MVCMSVIELQMLHGAEKECVEKIAERIDQAIKLGEQLSTETEIDKNVVSRATVTALLISAASTSVINARNLNQEVMAFSFIRCAADAMASLLAAPSRGAPH